MRKFRQISRTNSDKISTVRMILLANIYFTLNSSWTLPILLLKARPRMPPISTFSSFKNCWAVRKNSFTISNRSTKLSNLLKISCSWNSHNFGFLSPTKYVWSFALNSLKALRKLLKIFRVTRTLSKASSTSTYVKIV